MYAGLLLSEVFASASAAVPEEKGHPSQRSDCFFSTVLRGALYSLSISREELVLVNFRLLAKIIVFPLQRNM